jgi:hypothetical protein
MWRIWSFARQRLGKHHLKAGIATEVEVSSLGNGSLVSAPTDNKPKYELFCVVAAIRSSRMEAGYNTSTVALSVVGGDEKRSLESETVNYGREFHWTRSREWLRWREPAAIVNDRPVLSSERERERPTSTNSQLSDSNKNLVLSSRWVLYS